MTCAKSLVHVPFLLALAFLGVGGATLAEEQRADAPPSGDKGQYDFVAKGERVPVKDGDFSIKPPTGWEVYTHHPSLTLLMQVPFQQGIKYQRTIQVASFSDPRFIDEVTAKEYEDVIVRKFSVASASLVD